MNILMICSELAPLAKTGGLADAVTGLSGALAERGHEVVVLLPRYAHLGAADTITLTAAGGLRFGELRERTSYRRVLLEAPELFADPGLYLGDARDARRFLALSEAALELPAALGWRADVIHCHDWHAALVPVMLAAGTRAAGHVPSVLTLHNIGYQGLFDAADVDTSGHPELQDCIEDEQINYLAAGIGAADLITTVSPTYAREILSEHYGMGLDEALVARQDDLVGILNGVDYATWSPERDPHLAARYDARDTSPKRGLKHALESETGLAAGPERPLIGLVTRLAAQKGIDLLVAALPGLLDGTDAAFVLLGSGDAELTAALTTLSRAHPRRVSFTNGYDESLAHRILAGSDFVLVPSRYEPCGLTQLYALRYGSIPIVRKTGGLADTVQHFDPDQGRGNGSVFETADVEGLSWAVGTALHWYRDAALWAKLMHNAMAADFSWSERIPDYERLYAGLASQGQRP